MSHQDAVSKLPIGFHTVASTKDSKLTIIENIKKKFMEFSFIQRLHIQKMEKKFKNFIFIICKAKKSWQIKFEKNAINKIN